MFYIYIKNIYREGTPGIFKLLIFLGGQPLFGILYRVGLPARGVDVRLPEKLVALLAHAVQTGELRLVVHAHAAQVGEAPLQRRPTSDVGVSGERQRHQRDAQQGQTHHQDPWG